jgi:hypothetical protein
MGWVIRRGAMAALMEAQNRGGVFRVDDRGVLIGQRKSPRMAGLDVEASFR